MFLLAFLARLIVILDLHSHVLFDTPVVDAATYVDQARALAGGAPVTAALFWQPVFYPLYLSLIFRVLGPSLLMARLAQALLGSASCVLTSLLARRLNGRTSGWLAGLILALYGPVIALEADLLSEGWAVFWAALLLWLFSGLDRETPPWKRVVAGLCGGLAVLTRSNFFPVVLGLISWRVGSAWRAGGRKAATDAALMLIGGLLLALLPAAGFCREYTGRFTLLPSSSGVNWYLGNNPRWVETVSIRPGAEWTELFREAERAGASDPWEQSEYFRRRVLAYARSRPLAFATDLTRKTARFFCAREIPRNHDPYLLRTASPLLRVLMWKIGGFGFPFGALFPLALLGAVTQARRLGPPVWLFLVLYPASVIAVFVSDRYRLPLIPVLAVAAALGMQWLGVAFVSRRWSGGLAGVLLTAVLISHPRCYPEETLPYAAERHWAVGRRLAMEGRPRTAEAHLRRAAEINPRMPDVWNDLGILRGQQGRRAEAIASYRKAVELMPGNAGFRFNLGAALLEDGREEEARRELQEAIRLDPEYAPARNLYRTLSSPPKEHR